MAENPVVLGIDPGSRFTGWGVVAEKSGRFHLVDCGVIRTVTGGKKTFAERLAVIFFELRKILQTCSPSEAAIEQVFAAHNVASALKLGQARGVAVAACAAEGIPVSDYEPTLVKNTIVGTGRAEKEQVLFMVERELNVKRHPNWTLDTSDALAIAICHLVMRRQARLLSK